MPAYTFLYHRVDDSRPAVEAHEFGSDGAAIEAAERLLLDQPGCSEIQVIEGERLIHTCVRPPAPGEAAEDALKKVKRALELAKPRAAVIVTDRAGSILLWSDAATRLYGWTPSEAVGSQIVDVTPTVQSKRRAKAIMEDLRVGKIWEGEIVLRRRDRSTFRAYVVDAPVDTARSDGGLILGISAPADARAEVWESQASILKALQAGLGE